MERAHPNVTALYGRVKLAGEIELIAGLDCLVSMDSLAMHLAALAATPVVSVWGATHPSLGFLGYGADPRNVLQADMPCRPCSVFGNKPCRYGDYRCHAANERRPGGAGGRQVTSRDLRKTGGVRRKADTPGRFSSDTVRRERGTVRGGPNRPGPNKKRGYESS